MRRLSRFSLLDVLLWLLGGGILLFALVGSWLTLQSTHLTWEDWRSLIIFGVAQGSVYALIALGYTLVYGVLLMINFAHGDVFMFGAMTSFFVADALAQAGFLNANPIIGYVVVLAVAMGSSVLVAVLLERIAYRPLRRAPRLVPLITAIGASLFISNSVRGLYGEQVRAWPRIDALQGTIEIIGIPILKTQAVVIVAAVLFMAFLVYFVERTKTGRAM
ncbi:MAG TPA: branched-chain amino acid ABC transporter permease, partial [Candidatus Limnocylindria bacterium]